MSIFWMVLPLIVLILLIMYSAGSSTPLGSVVDSLLGPKRYETIILVIVAYIIVFVMIMVYEGSYYNPEEFSKEKVLETVKPVEENKNAR